MEICHLKYNLNLEINSKFYDLENCKIKKAILYLKYREHNIILKDSPIK